MASVVDGKSDVANPGRSAAEALRVELRQRVAGSGSSVCPSPASHTGPFRPHLLQQLQKASEKGWSRSTAAMSAGDDARKGGTFATGFLPSSSSCDAVILGQRSLPAPQSTPAASNLKGSRTASGPPGIGGGVKKRRSRPSKKTPTTRVDAECNNFRDLVQSLTGGTFCPQVTMTAPPIVSSPAVSISSSEVSGSSADFNVVQPSRPSPNVAPSDYGSAGEEVSTVSSSGGDLPVSQELPPFLLQSMLSDAACGGLNYMMGYTSQESWTAMEASMVTTESIGVSSSSPYQGVFASDGGKISGYNNISFLPEETDVSREGFPYQRDASLSPEYSKGPGSGDLLRHLQPEDDNDLNIECWLNPENLSSVKNLYI